MLRNLLIVTLLVSSLVGCASAAPTASVAVTPQTSAGTPLAPQLAKPSASAASPTLPPETAKDLRLTVVYDNTALDSQLKPDWGFAAVVEYRGHTVLFDTGADGPILLNNMRQLSMTPESIEAIVLSHDHNDHTGGLQALLATGIRPTVYAPSALSAFRKEQVRAKTKLVEVTEALPIFPGMYLTRPVGSTVEQALALETQDGTVLITGCGHPGLVEMIRQAQQVVPGKIALLAGGFHLGSLSKGEVAELRQLGVEGVMPTHCSYDQPIETFRSEFGESFVGGGVGRKVTFPVE